MFTRKTPKQMQMLIARNLIRRLHERIHSEVAFTAIRNENSLLLEFANHPLEKSQIYKDFASSTGLSSRPAQKPHLVQVIGHVVISLAKHPL